MPTKRAGAGAVTSAKLTQQQLRAVRLLVEARLPRIKIAQEIGISRMALWQWEQLPAFQAEIVRYGSEYRKRKESSWIAQMYRIQEERLKRLTFIRESLAEAGIYYEGEREGCATDDPDIGLGICLGKGTFYPGAETGLLMRHVKRVQVETEPDEEGKVHRTEREEVEWEWATNLLKELRALEDAVEREDNRIADLMRASGKEKAELEAAQERVLTERARRSLIEAQVEAIKSGNLSGAGTEPVKLTAVQIVEARRDPTEEP